MGFTQQGFIVVVLQGENRLYSSAYDIRCGIERIPHGKSTGFRELLEQTRLTAGLCL